MRIVQGANLQSLVQAVSGNTGTGGDLKPGVRFVAKILGSQDGMLSLELGKGQQIRASDSSGSTLAVGQTVTFEVSESSGDGNVYVKAVPTEPESLEGQASEMLRQAKIPDTGENRQLAKALQQFNVPLSSENLKSASSMNVQAQTVARLMDSGAPLPEKTEGESLLRDTAVQMVRASGQPMPTISANQENTAKINGKPESGDVTPTIASNVSEETAPAKSQTSNTSDLKNISESATTPALSELVENDAEPDASGTGGLKSSANPAVQNGNGDKVPGTTVASTQPEAVDSKTAEAAKSFGAADVGMKANQDASAPTEVQTNELRTILGNLTPDKIAFILKNQLPQSIGTINAVDQMLSGKQQLADQVQNLLNQLPNHASADVLTKSLHNILQTVNHSAFENPELFRDQLKTLSQEFRHILESSQTDSTLPVPKEALNDVRNSMDFLMRLNESLTYLHIPIQLPEGNSQMDLYVQRDKSGTRRINPNDTRIFISLETHHLDTVQCLAAVKNQGISLDFRVADEKVAQLFRSNFPDLKENLAALGYGDVNIQCIKQSGRLSLLDVMQMDTTLQGQFEYWV